LKFLGGESTQKVFEERGSGNQKRIVKFKNQDCLGMPDHGKVRFLTSHFSHLASSF